MANSKEPNIGGLLALFGAAIALGAALFMFKVEEKDFELIDLEDVFPEPDPKDLQPHMVFCMAPWGQILNLYFSAEEWQMLHQLVKMSGDSLDSIICEIAAERFQPPG